MENKQAVLVIDDSPPFRGIAESVLSQEGFNVITANDEKSGFEAARKELPCLILVDLVPDLDSYQFCKNIRLDYTLNDIPIVFLSSGNEFEGQDYNEKFGNVQYVQKTSGIEALTKTLKEALAGSEERTVSLSLESVSEDTRANADPGEEAVSNMPEEIESLPLEVPMPEVTLREHMSAGNEAERDRQTASTYEETGSHDSIELDSMFSDISFVDITTSEGSSEDDLPVDVHTSDSSEKEIHLAEPFSQQQSSPETDYHGASTVRSEAPTGEAPGYEMTVVNEEKSGKSSVKESVLVVDDSPTVRRLAELVLSQEGYSVLTAEDGDVGIEIARRENPAIVLVDFIMPKMNGFQFCKNLRSDPALSSIPIVLITSKGEDVGQGFDEKFSIAQYLKKPFETEALTKAVKEVLAEREDAPEALAEDLSAEVVPDSVTPEAETDIPELLQADAPTVVVPSEESGVVETVRVEAFKDETHASEMTVVYAEESEGSAEKESVLVVDDSPTVRRLAELVLSEEGYTVLTAEDGDVGIEVARRENPSVVLVDFIMPKMNGFQFCKSLRADPALSSIPIVLITSKGEDVGQGFDEKFSIAQYLKKPFETEALTKAVKEVLAEKKDAPEALAEDVLTEVIPETATPVAETDMPGPLQTDAPEALAEDVSAEVVPEVVAPETETDIPEPLQTDAPETFAEDVPAEVVPEAAAPEAEINLEIPVRADSPLTDISETETAPTDVRLQEEQLPDIVALDTSPADAQETELSSSADKPAVPVYPELMDTIEKEFRHYFGQELTALLKSTMFQVLKESDLLRSSGHILSGEIKYIPVASTLQFVSKSVLSGKLSVLTDSVNGEIYLESGEIAFASISKPGCRISLEELLIKDGDIGQEVLSALSEAGGNNLLAGKILLERGLMSENELSNCFRRMSEEAVHQILSASTGHFYLEDVPLPRIVQDFKLRILANGAGNNGICVPGEYME